jgi:Flp pilus assembly protein TadD
MTARNSDRGFDEAKAAADALEAVIAERPDFALAYPPLVRLYNTDFGYTALGSSGAAERDRALKLAKSGLAADRGNVHSHTVLGFCYLWHGEQDLARRCFEQAQTLNPYNPVRLEECATGWMFIGDVERARALMDTAFELNPIPDDDVQEDLGRLRMMEGDFEGARVALESVLGDSIWAALLLAISELRLDPDVGRTKLARWRERVDAKWHRRPAPSAAEISAWIRRHHPFPAELSERFFEGVEEALG